MTPPDTGPEPQPGAAPALHRLTATLRANPHLKTLARGSATSLTLRVAAALIGVGLQIFLARVLGADGYGLYTYPLAWLSLMLVLGRFGFDTATVRYVASYLEQRAYPQLKAFLSFSTVATLLTSGLVALVIALAVERALPGLGDPLRRVFRVVYVLVPATVLLQITESRLRALKRVFAAQASGKIARPLSLILLLGALALTGVRLDPGLAMAVNLASTLIAFGLGWLLFRRSSPEEVRRAEAAPWRPGEWLRASAALLLVAGFSILLLQTDTIMLGLLLGTREVGLYTASVRLASMMGMVLFALNYTLAPQASALYFAGEREQLQRLVTFSVNVLTVLSLGTFAALAAFGRPALGLFGPAYLVAYLPLVILAAAQAVNSMTGPVGILLNMTNHQNVAAVVLGATAVVNVALNLFLIPRLGLVGAALATAISTTAWNLAMASQVWRLLGIAAYPGAALLSRWARR